ncbi:TPA: hypothetical protein ACH3X3_009891 [Trebouxia sp. C0006]
MYEEEWVLIGDDGAQTSDMSLLSSVISLVEARIHQGVFSADDLAKVEKKKQAPPPRFF